MRLPTRSQLSSDRSALDAVELNLNCRDSIIPILRALQELYGNVPARQQILDLVGGNVNAGTSARLGRQGLDYWSITVLAAVRLGCNFDYDRLQDLAEQHNNLRLIMGVRDCEETLRLDWRRIRDNLCLLRSETLQQINEVIVGVGHQLAPQAIERVRGDTFVVETNVHYPTESSLIGDGLRKVVTLSARLAARYSLSGWRQHQHLLKKVKQIQREISRASRAKKQGIQRLQPGYRSLLSLAEQLLGRARELIRQVVLEEVVGGLVELGCAEGQRQELLHYVPLTEQVCGTARRRVLQGETVPNADKLFSIFEPHTELIKRGKQPDPIQYGHKVLVVEDAVGFLCHYQVVSNGVLDQDLVVPVMTDLQQRFDNKIQRASFDRGFHTPENQKQLAELVPHPCLAAKGRIQSCRQLEQASVEFRQARQHHPGVESAIGALQSGNGQKRCRDKNSRGYERYVGLGVLGRNLQVLGKLLIAQDNATCEAAKSKRKKQAG